MGYPILTVIAAMWVLPILGVRPRELIDAISAPVLAGVALCLVVQILAALLPHSIPAIVRLMLLVAAGGLTYGGYLLLFARDRIHELVDLVRRKGA